MTCCRFKTSWGRLLCLISSTSIVGGLICTMVGLSILPSGLPPNNGSVYISPPDSNYANDYNAYMMQSFGFYLMTRIGLPIFGAGLLGYLYMYRGGFIYDDEDEVPVRRAPNRRVTIAPEPTIIRVSRTVPVAPAHVPTAEHVPAPAAVAAPAAEPAPVSAPALSPMVYHIPSNAHHLPTNHNTYELRSLSDIRYQENMRKYRAWLGHNV